jgi:hypothetical protein
MSNYRMWAYSMIAVGFINWDYQRSHPHATRNSLLIIVPGLILLGLTFWPKASVYLKSRASQWLWALVGLAAIAFAFANK